MADGGNINNDCLLLLSLMFTVSFNYSSVNTGNKLLSLRKPGRYDDN
jgi:hypothetical protein